MKVLDFYDLKNIITPIDKSLPFEQNLELNPNASFFSVYDAYFTTLEYKLSSEVDTKSVPLLLAETYKKKGNEKMYKRFMKEYNKNL